LIGYMLGGDHEVLAVLMDGTQVISWHKTPTTPEVSNGIISALEYLLRVSRCPMIGSWRS